MRDRETASWLTRRGSLSRRQMLQGTGVAGLGLAAAALIGCGDDDDDDDDDATATATATGTAAPGGTAAGTATATAAPADQPKRGGILRPGGGGAAPHLDISKENTVSTGTPAGTLYSTLVRWDPTKFPDERVLAPDLAASWDAPDATTISFTLHDTTWHDGEPFTSADVAATVERAKEVHPFRTLFEVVESVDTPDDRTAVFHLTQPSNIFMDLLAAPTSSIMAKHIITDNADSLEETPVGTGPFRFDSWEKGVSISVLRNENYYAEGLPYLDGIRFIVLADSSAEVNGLRTGEIDASNWTSGVKSATLKEIQEDVPDASVYPLRSTSLSVLWMNNTEPPFDNDRVRRAVSFATDQTQVVELVQGGGGNSAGYVKGPVGLSDARRAELIPGFSGIDDADIAEAVKLMDAAGYKDGLEVDFVRPPGASYDNAQSVFQSGFGKIGLNLNPVLLTYPAEFVAAGREKRYQMAYGPWVFAVIHPVNYLGVNRSDDADNRNGYDNPEFDAKFDMMKETADPAELLELASELEEILIRDVPYVIGHGYGYIDVVRPEVGGWTPPQFLRDFYSQVYTYLK